jgi:hypothetical protein
MMVVTKYELFTTKEILETLRRHFELRVTSKLIINVATLFNYRIFEREWHGFRKGSIQNEDWISVFVLIGSDISVVEAVS